MKGLLVALGIIGTLLLFVWERVDVVRVGYRIEHLKAQKILLERQQDELRVKISAATAPDRLAKAATEKLGMIPPRPGQVILVHVPAPAPGAGDRLAEVRIAKTDRVWRTP